MTFVVFEGIDRSGKSTQCQLLYEALEQKGLMVKKIRYPDRNCPVTGKLINDYLGKQIELVPEAASLILLANLWQMKETLNRNDEILLMDRYIWSNVAYSAARSMSSEIFEKLAEGLPEPDLIVYLDADPQKVQRRSEYGSERFDRVEFQIRVKNEMEKLARGSNVLRIDAEKNQEDIHTELLAFFTIKLL